MTLCHLVATHHCEGSLCLRKGLLCTAFFQGFQSVWGKFFFFMYCKGVNSLNEWRAVAAGTFKDLQVEARPFEASDPTMCLQALIFFLMRGRTSPAVWGRPGAPATVARLGKGKKADFLRLWLTATRQRPPLPLVFCGSFPSGLLACCFRLCIELSLVSFFLFDRLCE